MTASVAIECKIKGVIATDPKVLKTGQGNAFLTLRIDRGDKAPAWLRTFHDVAALATQLKRGQLIRACGNGEPDIFKGSPILRLDAETIELVLTDKTTRAVRRRQEAAEDDPLASAPAAGSQEGSQSSEPPKADMTAEQIDLSLTRTAHDSGIAPGASLFEPRNPPKRSPQELAELAHGAEVTGVKSKYGNGFDPDKGDSLAGIF